MGKVSDLYEMEVILVYVTISSQLFHNPLPNKKLLDLLKLVALADMKLDILLQTRRN